tara:strand:- start:1074 stop:1268 length:195 start_codon:yes stop_codon:yes gene_type:complete
MRPVRCEEGSASGCDVESATYRIASPENPGPSLLKNDKKPPERSKITNNLSGKSSVSGRRQLPE